jgi:hypothetical protein
VAKAAVVTIIAIETAGVDIDIDMVAVIVDVVV